MLIGTNMTKTTSSSHFRRLGSPLRISVLGLALGVVTYLINGRNLRAAIMSAVSFTVGVNVYEYFEERNNRKGEK